jgi:hypothetical protein
MATSSWRCAPGEAGSPDMYSSISERIYRMRTKMLCVGMAITAVMTLGLYGCSEVAGPKSQLSAAGTTNAVSVVSQDLAQLAVAGETDQATKGVFSIGWKKFVGPDITDGGMVGEAYAVVHPETSSASIHPTGLDIGTVTLSYSGGSVVMTKRTGRDSSVLYETFGKGMRIEEGTAVNIPFVANSPYTFNVSGSSNFTAGAFIVTAPASLLSLTGHANGDTVSISQDLKIQWQGGSSTDSVLVRIVPHLTRVQMAQRGMHGEFDSLKAHAGKGGPGCHRQGKFSTGGPLEGLGPEFAKGVVVTVPNTGSYTMTASDLQTLLSGTTASEVQVGVTQVVKQEVAHDSGVVSVLLRNGDRVVLHAK